MNRRVVGIVAAIVLAAIGTIILVNFVNSAEDRALEGEELVEVFVVQQSIPAGTPIEQVADAVERERVPEKVRAQDAVTELTQLAGLVTDVALLPGEQLTAARFVRPEDRRGTRTTVEVPEGLLEVTIRINSEASVGAVIRPGDRVAVIASFPLSLLQNPDTPIPLDSPLVNSENLSGQLVTKLLLQKVLITNLQANIIPDEDAETTIAGDPRGDLLVTLALEPQDVEKLLFARLNGGLWMALQPETANEESTLQRGDRIFS